VKAILLAPIILLALFSAALPLPARADGIEVRSQNVQNRFPDGIQFNVFLGSNAEITSVRLRHKVMPDGVSVVTRPQCTTGASISCNALVGSTAQSYMVPGAEVAYSWEIEDASGARLQTPDARARYEDTRFNWQSLSDGNLTVYSYSGTEQSNSGVLRTARETIERFSKLEGTSVDIPLKIWVYATARDLQPAVASRRRSGPSNSVQTLGEVGASDTALVSRDTDFLNIVRHEVTHIVTRAATADHIAEFPIWINEGLSSYAQREMLPGEAQALSQAIQRNRVLPITSLGASARGSGDQVSLFYAQAGSIVAFMVEKLGEDKFAPFMQAIKTDTLDNALKKVYGLDLNGLENEWRKSVGLPPVDNAAGGSGRSEQQLPTIVPFGAQGDSSSSGQATPAAGGAAGSEQRAGGEGGSSALPVIIGAVAVVLAVAAGAFFLIRRRRANSAL
jgi:hypothetical protein